jgi:transcriptional regulator GlxA family with amidase domain
VSAGNCPVEYFREIERGLKTMTPYEQRRLISVACNILAMMGRKHDGRGESDLTSERFISLVHNHYMDVNININIIADMMGMHRTTLNRHFRQSMHYSPKDYLKQVRVQRAMTLLEEGKLTVAEIAVKVGMPNASHFARAIKKNTGKTPQGLRTISEG